jgi:3-phosphoshikimate 1-carboxyvinyltransferase
MGATVRWGDGHVEVEGSRLSGGVFDLRHVSDTAQTLAAVAVFADGPVDITGVGFIRRKETDRIAAMVAELRRCGVAAEELDDGMRIVPDVNRLHGGSIRTYDDHRMAMSMALVGLRVPGVEILDPDCVAKTFPEFFDAFDALRSGPVGDRELTVVALDGPAGAGKSTVAKLLAERLGIPHLDTGAMYRTVSAAALRAGVPVDDEAAVAELAADIQLEIGPRIVLDGIDATEEIRSPAVNQAVSTVAANSRVREVMVRRQREWAGALGGGVMEGRDIGTTVFPDAVLKAYLTASPEVRARRRHDQASGQSLEEIAADMARRDQLDSQRSDSPLRAAPGSIVMDTSELTLDQVVDQLADLYRSAVEER